MLQPLGSHHLLLVVPRYTFIKLFLLHLRPPSHSMYIISFSRASRTSAGLLTYVVCVRVRWPVHVHSCMCGCVLEDGKRGGEGRWGGDVAISVLQNAHYSSQAKQCACMRTPTGDGAGGRPGVCGGPPAGNWEERGEAGRRELRVIAPPLTQAR